MTDRVHIGVKASFREVSPNAGAGGGGSTPTGLFVSPTGTSGGAGTFADPWDLKSAVDGTQSLTAGDVINLLPGIYTADSADLSLFTIRNNGIEVRAYQPTCAAPYPARIDGGMRIDDGYTGVTLRDLYCYNTEAVPGGEPTNPGSPVPVPTPAGWENWSNGGTISAGTGSGHRIYNCLAIDGGGGFSFFKALNLVLEGCISYNVGWTGTDRNHGHPAYLQNISSLSADKCQMISCILSTDNQRDPAAMGHVAQHCFATTINQQNWDLLRSAIKGGGLFNSQTQIAQLVNVDDIIVEGVAVGTSASVPGNGYSIGRSTSADDNITVNDLLCINARKFIDNPVLWDGTGLRSPVPTLTQTNIRQVRTDAGWYLNQMDGPGSPHASPVLETGTHTDVSGGGGTDEYRVHVLANNSNRAHVYIVDFDLDGQVTVDLSAFASIGERVCIYHYQDFDTAVFDAVLTSTTVTLDIVDNSGNDASDAFVAYK